MRAIAGPRREVSDPRTSFNNVRQQLTPERIDVFNRIANEKRQYNDYVQNNFTGSINQQYNFSGYVKIGDLFN